jgi:hypothetical protein
MPLGGNGNFDGFELIELGAFGAEFLFSLRS